jgi:hypothetical protein
MHPGYIWLALAVAYVAGVITGYRLGRLTAERGIEEQWLKAIRSVKKAPRPEKSQRVVD